MQPVSPLLELTSHAIQDYTVLPATEHVWHSHLYSSTWFSNPGRMLSWVDLVGLVTYWYGIHAQNSHPSIPTSNWAQRRVTLFMQQMALPLRPSHQPVDNCTRQKCHFSPVRVKFGVAQSTPPYWTLTVYTRICMSRSLYWRVLSSTACLPVNVIVWYSHHWYPGLVYELVIRQIIVRHFALNEFFLLMASVAGLSSLNGRCHAAARMSPEARQANAGELGGQKPKE